jgi:hypothetical protein
MKLKTFDIGQNIAARDYFVHLVYEDGKDYTLSGSVIGDIIHIAWQMGINPYDLRDLMKEMQDEQNIS